MTVSTDVAERAQARVGEIVCDKWRLERLLGLGGMAAVYAAVHRNQNRVAIKMLHLEHCVDQNVKTRFLREGYVANTVEHPGAVRIFDDNVADDGAAFLVMELLDGETLIDRADRKGGCLEPGETLLLIDQLLDVLCAAHDKGILHRDIKPDNLFLTTEGRLKVLDFGIARVRELSGQRDNSTGVGTFMGTPSFMAPEQARARWEDVDVRSDVWAVGATLFSLLSGHNVHEADTVTEQLVLAVTQPAPSLAVHRPDLPAEIIGLVDKALAYRREDRWQTALEMQQALRAALATVGRPDKLSLLPRTSLSPGTNPPDTDETLAGPTELLSPTGNRRSGTLASAVTNKGAEGQGRSRRNARVAAFAVAGIFAATLLGMLVTKSSSTEEPVSASPLDDPPPAPRAAAPPEVPASEPPLPVVAATTEDVADEADAAAAATPKPQQARSASKSSARSLRPAPSVTAAPPPTEPPRKFDPFEKRY